MVKINKYSLLLLLASGFFNAICQAQTLSIVVPAIFKDTQSQSYNVYYGNRLWFKCSDYEAGVKLSYEVVNNNGHGIPPLVSKRACDNIEVAVPNAGYAGNIEVTVSATTSNTSVTQKTNITVVTWGYAGHSSEQPFSWGLIPFYAHGVTAKIPDNIQLPDTTVNKETIVTKNFSISGQGYGHLELQTETSATCGGKQNCVKLKNENGDQAIVSYSGNGFTTASNGRVKVASDTDITFSMTSSVPGKYSGTITVYLVAD